MSRTLPARFSEAWREPTDTTLVAFGIGRQRLGGAFKRRVWVRRSWMVGEWGRLGIFLLVAYLLTVFGCVGQLGEIISLVGIRCRGGKEGLRRALTANKTQWEKTQGGEASTLRPGLLGYRFTVPRRVVGSQQDGWARRLTAWFGWGAAVLAPYWREAWFCGVLWRTAGTPPHGGVEEETDVRGGWGCVNWRQVGREKTWRSYTAPRRCRRR